MKKFLSVVLLLSALTFFADDSKYIVKETTDKNGYGMFYIQNKTNQYLYCGVSYNNGYGYFDFYVKPRKNSEKYYTPRGDIFYACKAVEMS